VTAVAAGEEAGGGSYDTNLNMRQQLFGATDASQSAIDLVRWSAVSTDDVAGWPTTRFFCNGRNLSSRVNTRCRGQGIASQHDIYYFIKRLTPQAISLVPRCRFNATTTP